MRISKWTLTLAAFFTALAGCRSSDGDRRRSSGQGVPEAATRQVPYLASNDGFRITFPIAGAPKVEHHTQRSKVGALPQASYYVTQGDAAFDVTVTRYPAEVLARLTPGTALAVYRDGMVKIATSVVHEQAISLIGPGGTSVPGLDLELDMARGVRAFSRVAFYRDRAYALDAAAPRGDSVVDATTFVTFVTSFELTDLNSPSERGVAN